MPDISLQGDIVIRLLVASVLGAAIGFEREVHEHAAGTRTHLLVALGSTTFTVLSIYGFAATPGSGDTQPDPTRIAAQIVTGIGFLGDGGHRPRDRRWRLPRRARRNDHRHLLPVAAKLPRRPPGAAGPAHDAPA